MPASVSSSLRLVRTTNCAYRSWLSVALVGSILLIVTGIVAQRLQFAGEHLL